MKNIGKPKENYDFQWKTKENLWQTKIFNGKHKKTQGKPYILQESLQVVKTIENTKKKEKKVSSKYGGGWGGDRVFAGNFGFFLFFLYFQWF